MIVAQDCDVFHDLVDFSHGVWETLEIMMELMMKIVQRKMDEAYAGVSLFFLAPPARRGWSFIRRTGTKSGW